MELKQGGILLIKLNDDLLIVPYGIETSLIVQLLTCGISFNRTLWN